MSAPSSKPSRWLACSVRENAERYPTEAIFTVTLGLLKNARLTQSAKIGCSS
jgi:hypothetical protein